MEKSNYFIQRSSGTTKNNYSLTGCCQFIHTGPAEEVNIYLNAPMLLYGPEVTLRWLKVVQLIDKSIEFEKTDKDEFIIHLSRKNYADKFHMYATFIMLRWIWAYKDVMTKVFEIREKTGLIWFKCCQAAHSFTHKGLNNGYIPNNCFYVGQRGYIPQLLTYKEFTSKTNISNMFSVFTNMQAFDGTVEGLLKVKGPETLKTVTRSEKQVIDAALVDKKNKKVFCLIAPHGEAALNSLWTVYEPNPGYYQNLTKPFAKLAAVTGENGKSLRLYSIPAQKLKEIDIKKLKVE